MKKIISGFLALTLALSLVACSGGRNNLGKTFKTVFFNFEVVSAESVQEYGDYTAGEGEQLIDVVISTTNTFGSTLEMYDTDYQLQWEGDGTNDYSVVLDATDATMAPRAYDLADKETMTYHYLFYAPDDVKEFYIIFVEEIIRADGTEEIGDAFTAWFSIE